MKLRVGLIAPPFESVPPKLYGGTERVVHELACGLHAAHIETVVFASGDSIVPGQLIPTAPESLRLSPKTQPPSAAHHLKSLQLVKRHAPEIDVLHNHNDFWMLPLHDMVSTPMVTTLHGRLDLPELSDALHYSSESQFISISDSQRAPLPELPWNRTIYHGLDLTRFRFNPRPGHYLAFLGRISPEKRPDLAIEISKRSGIPLKIAAKIERGVDEAYFESKIKPHIDGKHIEYIGEISEREKSEFLGEALGLAFPIDWPEPFGLVMIESLACGTPVLARPMGSVPEILEEGKTAFLHFDIEVLAKKALELSSLDRLTCRQVVAERFSIERMTQDHLEVYRWILNSRN